MNNNNSCLRVALTGATGYLGSNVLHYFSQQNVYIKILIRDKHKNHFKNNESVEIIWGDLHNTSSLKELIKDVDVCIHMAALVSEGNKKEEYEFHNVNGTDNLCNAILQNNRNCHLIYCSSYSVLNFNNTPKFIRTHYAKSKKMAENKIEYLITNNNLKATIIYPAMIYGPGDYKFLPPLLKASRKIFKYFLLSGGEKDVPLSYIDDLCELFYNVSDRPTSYSQKINAFIIEHRGIHGLIQLLLNEEGLKISSIVIPYQFFVIIVFLIDFICNLFHVSNKSVLNRRTINVLTLNASNYIQDKDYNSNLLCQTSFDDGIEKNIMWLKNEKVIQS